MTRDRSAPATTVSAGRAGWLDRLERIGNALPEPAILFALGIAVVVLLSAMAAGAGWSVAPPPGSAEGSIEARSLLAPDGIWWFLGHFVANFVAFPPLGVVIVGMLGVGVAERSGLLPALLGRLLRATPDALLVPATLFAGVMSSLALDVGYVLLPPLAAALFLQAGRSPLVGIACAFAGTAAGYGANLLLTPLDAMLAGFTESGAHLIDPTYRVAITCNWWLMAASTLVLTGVGWLVVATVTTRRLALLCIEPPPAGGATGLSGAGNEARGLRAAAAVLALLAGLIALAIVVPGAPLYGAGEHHARWIEASVPLLFLLTLLPGIAYGMAAGTVRSERDVTAALVRTFAELAPYLVMAFCAAQFIECFKYSRLGEMLALTGGSWLRGIETAPTVLIGLFILGTMTLDLLVASASAKYALLAPVFVPMFMQVGISPELTQAAYRIADSTSNVITPLNPYMVMVLAVMQRYAPRAGLGTLIAAMLPISIGFALAWTALLGFWIVIGLPLGPGGPLFLAAGSPP